MITNYIVTKETSVIDILREINKPLNVYGVMIDAISEKLAGIGVETPVIDVRLKDGNICISNFGAKSRLHAYANQFVVDQLVRKIDELDDHQNSNIKVEIYMLHEGNIQNQIVYSDIKSIIVVDEDKTVILKDHIK